LACGEEPSGIPGSESMHRDSVGLHVFDHSLASGTFLPVPAARRAGATAYG
jgi:hypothetical protein